MNVATSKEDPVVSASDEANSGETGLRAAGESQRVPALDGLRGFAILSVVLFHYINNQLPEATSKFATLLREATSFGWAGVDLFFVLSAFC